MARIRYTVHVILFAVQTVFLKLLYTESQVNLKIYAVMIIFLCLSEQDDVYNNRRANYYYGDRSLLKKVKRMAPRAFRELFRQVSLNILTTYRVDLQWCGFLITAEAAATAIFQVFSRYRFGNLRWWPSQPGKRLLPLCQKVAKNHIIDGLPYTSF